MNNLSLLNPSKLRPMQAEDIEAVMEIELLSYSHPWKDTIYRDCLRAGYSCWVMEQGQKIIGYAVMSAAAGEAHILNLCIAVDYRGSGFGREFMTHLMDVSREHKAETIFLEVRASNGNAFRLYEGLGFAEVGLRRDYYPATDGREDAIIMAKELI